MYDESRRENKVFSHDDILLKHNTFKINKIQKYLLLFQKNKQNFVLRNTYINEHRYLS